MQSKVRILFFGDVVGAMGRKGLAKMLPALKERFSPDLTIANAENLSHGAGITEKTLNELSEAGVDVFTGGNHSWNNPMGSPLFDHAEWKDRLVTPMNYGGAKNGRACTVASAGDVQVLIFNVMGQLFTHPDTKSPFTAIDELLNTHGDKAVVRIVDVHAEATSEKEALGHYIDGRVSAVLGTHTHVATADAKILPGGTAYVTDVGRCGDHDSVVGFEKKAALQRYLTSSKGSYDLRREGTAEINGIALTIDPATGKTLALDRIREFVDV